jgi:hypothetical protein
MLRETQEWLMLMKFVELKPRRRGRIFPSIKRGQGCVSLRK